MKNNFTYKAVNLEYIILFLEALILLLPNLKIKVMKENDYQWENTILTFREYLQMMKN